MNVTLLGAGFGKLTAGGLPPVTFAAVQSSDLLAGVRGVRELNRTELLCDVFAAAGGEPLRDRACARQDGVRMARASAAPRLEARVMCGVWRVA